MSKTMTYLRKYQKVVFSVLCVVLVVTWGLSYSADQLMSLGRGGAARNPTDEVVLTWVGGRLTQHQLDQKRRAHIFAVRYVFAVMQKAQELKGRPSVPILDQGSPLPPGNDAQTTIDIMLRAEKARRMGVQVNDNAVKQFLLRLGGDVLREGDLAEIARETLGREMSPEALLAQLQEELLAQQTRLMALGSLTTLSLGDDWEYFCRLNRRMQIEAYGLDVDAFLDQVKAKPTPKELRTLYDKYKDQDPDPNLPEPGFRNLKKIAWDYVKFDFAPYLDEAKKKVTDEQVQKYYDDAIKRGEFKVKPPEEKKPDSETKDGDKPEESGDKPANKDDKPAAEDKADKPAPGSDTPPEDKKPAEKQDQSAAPAADSSPKSDEVTPGDPSAKQAADPAPAEKSKPESEAKPADAKPAEDKPGDEKPGDEKGAKTGADNAGEPAKFKPLEEVRDEIVTILARPIAQDAVNKNVKQLTDALQTYNRKRLKYEGLQRNSKGKTKAEDPGEFELEPLAKELGAKPVETPLVNRYELSELELGREGIIFFREVFQVLPFADVAYSRRITLFEPQTVMFRGEPETTVVVWARKEEAPQPTKFEDRDVQERLVAAWKKQQAVEKAKHEAEALAKQASDKNTLEEALPSGSKVITTGPFSWLTSGAFTPAQGARVSLSQVEGIDRAGPEFMEAVSRLKVGETGVALDHPHNRVYVVRLLKQEPSEEELRDRFLESGSSMAVRQAAGQEMSRLAQQWEEQLAEEMKVVYHRTLDAPVMDEQ